MPISTNFLIRGKSRTFGSFFVNGSTLTSTFKFVSQILRSDTIGTTYLRYAHKRHSEIPNERWVLHKLHPEPCCGNEAFDNGVDGNWDLEPVPRSDKELEHHVNIMEAELTPLARKSLISQRNLVVLWRVGSK